MHLTLLEDRMAKTKLATFTNVFSSLRRTPARPTYLSTNKRSENLLTQMHPVMFAYCSPILSHIACFNAALGGPDCSQDVNLKAAFKQYTLGKPNVRLQ